MEVSASDILRLVGPRVADRGLYFFRSRRVQLLQRLADEGDERRHRLRARVEAEHDGGTAYFVQVTARRRNADSWHIDGRCTCEQAVNCTHVAATLFAAAAPQSPEPPEDADTAHTDAVPASQGMQAEEQTFPAPPVDDSIEALAHETANETGERPHHLAKRKRPPPSPAAAADQTETTAGPTPAPPPPPPPATEDPPAVDRERVAGMTHPCLQVFHKVLRRDPRNTEAPEVAAVALARLRWPPPADPPAEAVEAAVAALESFGARPLQDLFVYEDPYLGARCFVLGTEADADSLYGVTEHTLPRLESKGWQLEVDPKYPYRVVAHPGRCYASITTGQASIPPVGAGRRALEEHSDDESAHDNDAWFDLEMGIEVDGQRVSLMPTLLSIVQRFEGPDAWESVCAAGRKEIYLKLEDGRAVPFSADRLQRILGVLRELYERSDGAIAGGSMRIARAHAAPLAELTDEATGVQVAVEDELMELGACLAGKRPPRRIAPPYGLRASLRPYQVEGLSWLQFLRANNIGGILADDMGLGKTLQVISHILKEHESGRMATPTLVVAPTSLMSNWSGQIAQFAPTLRVLTLHGDKRGDQFHAITQHDVVLTTFQLVLRDIDVLAQHTYHLLILDESQSIKNPDTKAYRAVQSLSALHKLCLSGTPMENHLGELWAQLNFLMPGLLGGLRQFRFRYQHPIEREGDEDKRHALIERVRPFMLRRTKVTVAKDLPPKTEVVRRVELTGAQRDLYESIRLAVQGKVWQAVQAQGLAQASITILDALLKLRQLCCDPRLLSLQQAREVDGSAKLSFFIDLMTTLVEEGRRVLVFSQFATMLRLIGDELAARGISFVVLTGSTKDRATPMEQFQARKVPVFLISLKAGGAGLNLTAADTVIHYDPWWNPAVEAQATDRAHRIGQVRPVHVYKLLVRGSVEERIAALQRRKWQLARSLIEPQGAGPLGLSEEELGDLLAPLGSEQ